MSQMSQVIMIANPKGGAGKTTLASNLCGYFAYQNQKVALVDLDRQQSSLRWLALRNENLAAITGFYAGNQLTANLPRDFDRVVVDTPAGLQGYKLSDYLRAANKLLVPFSASVFDMNATEDFIRQVKQEMLGARNKIALVAIRTDMRNKAAQMLKRFAEELHLPIVATLRPTQNYVNAALAGLTIFDGAQSKNKKDVVQWQPLLNWLEN